MDLKEYSQTILNLVSQEFPGAESEVQKLMGDDSWRFGVGSEAVVLKVADEKIQVNEDRGEETSVIFTISPKALMSIVDGDMSVSQALASEDLVCKGTCTSLIRMSESLSVVLSLILRSRRMEIASEHFLDQSNFKPRRPRLSERSREEARWARRRASRLRLSPLIIVNR